MAMDETTFREFLRDNRDRIYGYARYFLGDREDAEDVTQEAFVRAWRSCPASDDAGRRAWLTRVAHNLCVDADRRRRVRRGVVREAAEGELERQPDRRPEAVDPLATLLQRQEAGRRLEAVVSALAELPAESRSVVLLHYWQGMSLREIAASLGRNETAVKVRAHRARRTLRNFLTGHWQQEVSA